MKSSADKLPVFQVNAGLTPSGFFATVISLLLELNYKFINGTGALAMADPIYQWTKYTPCV